MEYTVLKTFEHVRCECGRWRGQERSDADVGGAATGEHVHNRPHRDQQSGLSPPGPQHNPTIQSSPTAPQHQRPDCQH